MYLRGVVRPLPSKVCSVWYGYQWPALGMAKSKNKASLLTELKTLEPTLQTRIRRSFVIAGVWGGFILLSALGFTLSKPYLNKKRKERMKQPGYKPRVTLKEDLPYHLYGRKDN